LVELYTYRLPFAQPFSTAAGTIDSRTGLLIRFCHNGLDLTAEAAPLPGFSPDSLEEVTDAATAFTDELTSLFTRPFKVSDLRKQLTSIPELPSLQFALSWLGAGILMQRGIPPFKSLLNHPPADRLLVNEVIPQSDLATMKRDIRSAYKAGFRTFKFKAGFPVQPLPSQLRDILQEFSDDIKIRLDANRSWPCKTVGDTISLFEGMPIEYIEEPCRFDSDKQLGNLIQSSPIPLALDESIAGLKLLKSRMAYSPKVYLILKPTILGNLFDLFETLNTLQTPYERVIVTTALESSVGRAMTATVAGLIGSADHAHGLNTGRFFKSDLNGTIPSGISRLDHPNHLFNKLRFSDLNHTSITRLR
jgi:o-succinylbenzoate synthase